MTHVISPFQNLLIVALTLVPVWSSAQTPEGESVHVAASSDEAGVVVEQPPEPAPVVETPLLGVGPRMPPTIDPGMYPPTRVPSQPRPYLEVHGFTALWLTPLTNDDAPQRMTETVRLRWAVLRFDANPTRHLHVVTRLGFMADPALLDASVTWSALQPMNITFGQFRMPFGAAATTLAPQLVMLDRPSYVYAMTKATFRDVGVMLHSGDGGLARGLFHYRLAMASGNGRLLSGEPMRAEQPQDLLWVARMIVDPGARLEGVQRLAAGATLAWTRDPGLDMTDPALARRTAANLLGRTWVPLAEERDTVFAGADVTLATGAFWLQAEFAGLMSAPTSGADARRSLGTSLELAYRLPWTTRLGTAFQLAARVEQTDPDLDANDDDFLQTALGINVLPTSPIRFSAFGKTTLFADEQTGESRVGGEVTLRATLAF